MKWLQVFYDPYSFHVIPRLGAWVAANPAAYQYLIVVVHPGDHDLAVARLGVAMHRDEVAVEDAGVAHAYAAHTQQVVGPGREQRGVELVARLDVFGGEDGAARGDAADQGQAERLAFTLCSGLCRSAARRERGGRSIAGASAPRPPRFAACAAPTQNLGRCRLRAGRCAAGL